MRRHRIISLSAGLVALLAACITDPTDGLRGGVARVAASFRYLVVVVGDSTSVSAQALDQQGNPLPDIPEVASATPAVATVQAVSGAPLSQTKFFVKAVGFGVARVIVSAGGVADTVTVQTYPARVTIAAPGNTIGSGNTTQLTAEPRSRAGAILTGVTPIAWSSSDETIATVDGAGLVTGKSPGNVTISAEAPGEVVGSRDFTVVPGTFGGSLSAASGEPGELITINRGAGGPPFDVDTRVAIRGRNTFIRTRTADALEVPVPPTEVTGAVELLIANMGPDQIAQTTTFTANSAGFDDRYTPDNNDPFTGPPVTNGDYYFILHGTCEDAGNGIGEGGANCDDFFTITNPSGSDASVTLEVGWFGGADVDFYVVDDTFSSFIVLRFTTNNPELATITIPANTTYIIWINMYDPAGGTHSFSRLRVSGLP